MAHCVLFVPPPSSWHDRSGYNDSDCSGDCDCACPIVRSAVQSPLLPTSRLYLHPDARWMRLKSDASLVYVPSHTSGIVVNDALRAWLEQLPASGLTAATPQEHELVTRCVALGVLTSPTVVPVQARSDTLVAWMHVTNDCNLRCTYCYVEKTDQAMSAATGYAAVEAVIRSARANGYRAFRLKYAGGEAALNFPLVQDLHAYAQNLATQHDLDYQGVLLSNGVGLTRYRLEHIRSMGLRLMISLDGIGAANDRQRIFFNGRGSFAIVAKTIDRARAAGVIPQISITVTGENADSLPETIHWMLDRELPFSLNFYRESEQTQTLTGLQLDEQRIITGMRAAYRVIEERLPQRSLLGALLDRTNLSVAHQNPCGVGDSYMVIDPLGSVAQCQMAITNPVTTITAGDPLRLVRSAKHVIQLTPVDQRDTCGTCEWRYWCAGGCPMISVTTGNSSDLRSPYCRIYKALFPEVLRLEGLRILKYGAVEQFDLMCA